MDQTLVQATAADQVAPAIEEITALLRQRHRIRADETDDFSIRDISEAGKIRGLSR